MKPRILITGPIAELPRWADAARAQGWNPIVYPLLEVRHRLVHLSLELESEPDWICVTSKHAVRFLEDHKEVLCSIPCAAVGVATARRLEASGFEVRLIGPRAATDLVELLVKREDRPRHVLWPRGSISDELEHMLLSRGIAVCAPIVYETNERVDCGSLPKAEVVFFASPSAVRAYSRRIAMGESLSPCAISIGPATVRSLASPDTATFERVIELPDPEPNDLGLCLVGLELNWPD
ncbi:MAG: uroporphyrinogen-III synthase [Planctomycetota bacterium]|jgi:uroporphyrinogen-III synthase